MKLSAISLIFLCAALTGCHLPQPAGELILTEEDYRLKRTPYRERACIIETQTQTVTTSYSK